MDSLMREDNGDQSHRVFDMSANDLDFHPYPLTFRDALSTDELSHPGQVFTSVVPMDLDSRHEEVNPRDKDDDSERVRSTLEMYLLRVRTSKFFQLQAVRLAALRFAGLRVVALEAVFPQITALAATSLMMTSLKASALMMLTLTTSTLMAWSLGYHEPQILTIESYPQMLSTSIRLPERHEPETSRLAAEYPIYTSPALQASFLGMLMMERIAPATVLPLRIQLMRTMIPLMRRLMKRATSSGLSHSPFHGR